MGPSCKFWKKDPSSKRFFFAPWRGLQSLHGLMDTSQQTKTQVKEEWDETATTQRQVLTSHLFPMKSRPQADIKLQIRSLPCFTCIPWISASLFKLTYIVLNLYRIKLATNNACSLMFIAIRKLNINFNKYCEQWKWNIARWNLQTLTNRDRVASKIITLGDTKR